jgi:hypothetical protein
MRRRRQAVLRQRQRAVAARRRQPRVGAAPAAARGPASKRCQAADPRGCVGAHEARRVVLAGQSRRSPAGE